jgi:hypothetical protein
MTLPALLSSAIGGGSQIASMVSSMQPLISLATSIAGIFDKPNISDAPTRTLETNATNWTQADVPDQALPLALYSTSYQTNGTIVPDGGAWSFARMAMVPGLHTLFALTNTTTSATIPFMGYSTPFSLAASLHYFWRGSLRVQFRAYCSAFVSARVLITYRPLGVSSTASLDNNQGHLIDVKGDTAVSLSFPFVSRNMYYNNVYTSNVPGTILVSLWTPIVSANSGTTPTIDFVVFSAADADAQFSGPGIPPQRLYTAPPADPVSYQSCDSMVSDHAADLSQTVDASSTTLLPRRVHQQPRRYSGGVRHAKFVPPRSFRIRRPSVHVLDSFVDGPEAGATYQCDVAQEFSQTFPPICPPAAFYTDNHAASSEVSNLVTDVMKRYQAAVINTSTIGDLTYLVCPLDYSPKPGSVGYILDKCFMYQRGGVSYKAEYLPWSTVSTTESLPFNVVASYTNLYPPQIGAVGNPEIHNVPRDHAFDFSLPWYYNLPYIPTTTSTGVTSSLFVGPSASTIISNVSMYTAVRDDYEVGFLLAPNPNIFPDPLPRFKTLEPHSSGRRSVAKQNIDLDFFVLAPQNKSSGS